MPAIAVGGTLDVAGTAVAIDGAEDVRKGFEVLQMANQSGSPGGDAHSGGGDGAAKKGAGAADDVFHVTPDGVVLPKGSKHKIPEGYVENPHRSGSYGEIVNGKFKERLRIDPPTPPGQKGPNTSHYHLDGKGKHYSPAPGDKAPGFQP